MHLYTDNVVAAYQILPDIYKNIAWLKYPENPVC